MEVRLRLYLSRASVDALPGLHLGPLRGPVLPLRRYDQIARAMTTIRLSERDQRVVLKCAVGKWLTTGQLTRLYFPGVTSDAARKSLRRLADAGYLVSHREHQMAESLHGIGPKGKSVLEAKGLSAEVVRTPPRQSEHLIGLNDIRVAVETSNLQVAYFFASWEVQALGWLHPIVPDAVLGLRLPDRQTFFLEYDRGSETLATLIKKLRCYEEGLSGIHFRAVLVIAESAPRLELLARQMRKAGFFRRMLSALKAEILEAGIGAPVFRDLARHSQHQTSLGEISES
jgi:hypothetical protein